jgi:TRAP transporter TAXI family solute receptor
MKRIVMWSCVLAGLCAILSGAPARAAQPLRLATGGAGDFFWIMGNELSRIWDLHGIPTEAVETTGDRENLELLVSNGADVAFVSGFALADFLREHREAPIVTVASCWKSAVNVLLNKKFAVTGSVRDLDGRRLYLGGETSPEGMAVRRMLSALGVGPNKYARETTEFELLAVMTNFQRRELDGAIVIGPVPDPMVRDIIDGTGDIMRLVGADEAVVSTLAGAGLPVFLMTIPTESYPYQHDDLNVIATGTYLVARPDLPDDTARELWAGIFENTGQIAAYFPQGGVLSVSEAAAHLIAPLHPALK